MIKSTRKRVTHQSRSGDPSATQCLLCAVPTRCVFLSAGSRVTAQHWSWHMSLPSQDLSQDGMSQWRSSQIYKCHDQNIDSGYLSLWKWIDYSHPHPMGRHSIFDHGEGQWQQVAYRDIFWGEQFSFASKLHTFHLRRPFSTEKSLEIQRCWLDQSQLQNQKKTPAVGWIQPAQLPLCGVLMAGKALAIKGRMRQEVRDMGGRRVYELLFNMPHVRYPAINMQVCKYQ